MRLLRTSSLSDSLALFPLPANVPYLNPSIRNVRGITDREGNTVTVVVRFLASLSMAMRSPSAVVHSQSKATDALLTHVTTYVLGPRVAPRCSSLPPARPNHSSAPRRLRVIGVGVFSLLSRLQAHSDSLRRSGSCYGSSPILPVESSRLGATL